MESPRDGPDAHWFRHGGDVLGLWSESWQLHAEELLEIAYAVELYGASGRGSGHAAIE